MIQKKLRIVMMGTTDFAVPALKRLVEEPDFDIVTVVCQPDRPNGRGKKIKFLPVKEVAIQMGLPLFQPEKIRDKETVAYLISLEADMFIVAAYGQILSQEVLDIPALGCLNIHGSLLPEYRGAAPIHRAIIDGKNESGVTIMKMDSGMDTGDMLCKGYVSIDDSTTAGELHDKLANLGADLLVDTIRSVKDGTVFPEKQNNTLATYADKVDRETGKIDWSESSRAIVRRINGTTPFPGAYTMIGNQKMKCFLPVAESCNIQEKPGTVLNADAKLGLLIKTGDGAIRLRDIQMPGKKRMSAKDYLRGNSIETGIILA